MAISTVHTYLMHYSASKYEKLLDIKDFPDLGGAPEAIDTTTLSDTVETKINGIQKLDTLEFTANYSKEDYSKILALANKENEKFAICFGSDGAGQPDGHNGIVKFEGQISASIKGAKINEAVEMGISISASKAPALADSLNEA